MENRHDNSGAGGSLTSAFLAGQACSQAGQDSRAVSNQSPAEKRRLPGRWRGIVRSLLGERFNGAPLFAWGVWGLLFLSALAFVGIYSTNVPWCEDFSLVPYLSGDAPITFSALWAQQGSEHRLFLMNATFLALLRLTGGDFRAPLFFCVASLGWLAFAMIQVAKRVRGWTSYTDAFFPFALLYLGLTGDAAYWGQRITYLLATLLAGTILLIIVRRGTHLTLGAGLSAGICLALLPLCGGHGLVYVPALTIWLGYSGLLSWRSPERQGKWNGPLSLAPVATSLLVVLLYFIDFRREESFAPPSPSLWVTLKSALAFLTGSLGSAAVLPFWPFSALLMFLLLVLSTGMLVVVLFCGKQALARSRALGLLFFMGAIGTVALAVAWGRAGLGGTYFVVSYSLSSVLTLCCIYFSWILYRPRTVGYFAQMCLLTLIALAVPLNVQVGLQDARNHCRAMESFQRALRDGVPPYRLIARYGSALGFRGGPNAGLSDYLRMLRRAGIGPFQYLQEDPPFQEMPLSLTPVAVNMMKWENGTGQGTVPESSLTFALPQPRFVGGIRIRLSPSNSGTANVRIFWRRSDKSDFPKNEQCGSRFGVGDELTICIADTIDQIRIHPDDKPFDVVISEIVCLIPETGEPTAVDP